jgi:hypothetical protein
MSPPVAFFAKAGRYEFPEELVAVYRHEPLVLEVMFPITYGGIWDYPYPEAQALTESLRDQLGAHRLVWGSDMPNVERFCTYRQTLETFTVHCRGLVAEADIVNIVGGTAARLFGLGREALGDSDLVKGRAGGGCEQGASRSMSSRN